MKQRQYGIQIRIYQGRRTLLDMKGKMHPSFLEHLANLGTNGNPAPKPKSAAELAAPELTKPQVYSNLRSGKPDQWFYDRGIEKMQLAGYKAAAARKKNARRKK